MPIHTKAERATKMRSVNKMKKGMRKKVMADLSFITKGDQSRINRRFPRATTLISKPL